MSYAIRIIRAKLRSWLIDTFLKHAVVIAAGIGGLALVIRLQSSGVATTILEARDRPGGRAYVWEKEGFVFDTAPTFITDPACLAELWELGGHVIEADVDLIPATPFYRLNWPDGTNFDYGIGVEEACHYDIRMPLLMTGGRLQCRSTVRRLSQQAQRFSVAIDLRRRQFR